ncbi:unnamed protein product [Nezara viridula]|uniref:Uncharacterized protein n=1 Tax=Nezara viridula TaxID=85310 RepID=A0A9P0HTU5_NEZVI|nr:unnamed protein product [Nezara viridula]
MNRSKRNVSNKGCCLSKTELVLIVPWLLVATGVIIYAPTLEEEVGSDLHIPQWEGLALLSKAAYAALPRTPFSSMFVL